jgi:hypothetical protein
LNFSIKFQTLKNRASIPLRGNPRQVGLKSTFSLGEREAVDQFEPVLSRRILWSECTVIAASTIQRTIALFPFS